MVCSYAARWRVISLPLVYCWRRARRGDDEGSIQSISWRASASALCSSEPERYFSCEAIDDRTCFLFCVTTQKRGASTSRSPSGAKATEIGHGHFLDVLDIAVHVSN